ncbi:MAG: hypothetical protein U9M98_01560 [Patescibacteria group bacterium]|nr:hypothetical protein [Patescibacteria group bacterium]
MLVNLTSYQTDVCGLRGAIDVDGNSLYLAFVSDSTVPEAVYEMKVSGQEMS